MIAGNPRAGRKLVVIAITLLLGIVITTAVVALRKKSAPMAEPPLHSSERSAWPAVTI